MVAVAHPEDVESATKILAQGGETIYRIGQVVSRPGAEPEVVIENMDAAWSD
jgi:phosphoribosylaminoimidazole (AIR) synthetase